MENLKKILEEISLDQMMDRIHYMTENFPYRLSGSETEEKAARYVTNVMESYGMEAEMLEFDAYNSTPMESKVEIISPEKFQIDSLPCGHIRSTGKDGRDFEIVYVADGSISAYEEKDVRGQDGACGSLLCTASAGKGLYCCTDGRCRDNVYELGQR